MGEKAVMWSEETLFDYLLPEEVHSGHQDGFRGLEEAKGQSRPHRPLEEGDVLNAFIHSLTSWRETQATGRKAFRKRRERRRRNESSRILEPTGAKHIV